MYRKKKDGTSVYLEPGLNDIKNLLHIYSSLQDAILERTSCDEQVFSTRNLVGEYAEILCCERLSLTQEIASNEAFDATDKDGKKYQIKARQLYLDSSMASSERQMGNIKESALKNIDYVILVLFNKDFSINTAFRLSTAAYQSIASWDARRKEFRIILNKTMIGRLNREQDFDNVMNLEGVLNV